LRDSKGRDRDRRRNRQSDRDGRRERGGRRRKQSDRYIDGRQSHVCMTGEH